MNKKLSIHQLSGILLFFFCLSCRAGDQNSSPVQNSRLPIARIGESIICCPLDSVTIDGWASIDIGGEIIAWLWDTNSDGKTDTITDRGELTFVAPAKSGSRTITLRVEDNDHTVSAPESTLVNVMKSNPVVAMAHDTTIKIGVRLSFEPLIRTNCGSFKTYEWDFNDDGMPDFSSNESPKTSRAYLKPGRFAARFKVTDCFGRCAGGIQLITVN